MIQQQLSLHPSVSLFASAPLGYEMLPVSCFPAVQRKRCLNSTPNKNHSACPFSFPRNGRILEETLMVTIATTEPWFKTSQVPKH